MLAVRSHAYRRYLSRQIQQHRLSSLQEASTSSSPSLPTTSPSSANVAATTPIKTMIFIDGTWLYYTMIEGRGNCPIQKKYGAHWKRSYTIDYLKLTQLIASNLREQIYSQSQTLRAVDVVRTYVFTSTRQDTEIDSYRQRMIMDMYSSNFEVHRFLTDGRKQSLRRCRSSLTIPST